MSRRPARPAPRGAPRRTARLRRAVHPHVESERAPSAPRHSAAPAARRRRAPAQPEHDEKAAQPHANPGPEKLSRINTLMVNEGLVRLLDSAPGHWADPAGTAMLETAAKRSPGAGGLADRRAVPACSAAAGSPPQQTAHGPDAAAVRLAVRRDPVGRLRRGAACRASRGEARRALRHADPHHVGHDHRGGLHRDGDRRRGSGSSPVPATPCSRWS